MKYGKLVGKLLSHRSNQHNTQVAIALIAGLAAGAVISILLAPEKGSTLRGGIAEKAKDFGTGIRDSYSSLRNRVFGEDEQHPEVAPEVPHFTHTVPKKRKSDIKDIITEAHQNAHPTEQSLS